MRDKKTYLLGNQIHDSESKKGFLSVATEYFKQSLSAIINYFKLMGVVFLLLGLVIGIIMIFVYFNVFLDWLGIPFHIFPLPVIK